jgi:hypothetical protein
MTNMMIITDLQGSILVQEGSMLYELCLESLLVLCCTYKIHRSIRSSIKREFMFIIITNLRGTLDKLLVYTQPRILFSNTCASYYKMLSSMS